MSVDNKKNTLEMREEEGESGDFTAAHLCVCAGCEGDHNPAIEHFEAKTIAFHNDLRQKVRRIVLGVLSVVPCVFSSIVAAEPAGGVSAAASHQNVRVGKAQDPAHVPSALKGSHNCLALFSEAEKLHALDKVSFVDVRSPEEYARYHIAGSINIPLHMVRTKEFLKATPVLLVNDGRCTIDLENTCRELRQSGFKDISVLDGGLFAWHASQRPLEGDPIELSRLSRMSVEELFEVRALANWTVIEVAAPGKNNDIRSWLPANVIMIPPGSISTVSSTIQQLRKKNSQEKILLIADSDDIYQRVDAQLQKSGIASGVLHLDGGIKGYRAHIKNQQALWRQQNEPRRYEACRG
ncbi:MAG TPA: rhodanese-like domain-containing protein [Gallionella sp.]|nr:rhodanese-like domain-containing protein [Gallionella sp.]